jgi:hypothetical protein
MVLQREHLVSITKGMEGTANYEMMIELRENPLKEINGERVIWLKIAILYTKNLLDGSESEMTIPKSNVLIYYTEDGSKYVPDLVEQNLKIKFYISVNTTLETVEDFVETQDT